jgi:predicted Zn-dependent protease
MKRQNFEKFGEELFSNLCDGEELNLTLSMEDSLFLRFNEAKSRQVTDVVQGSLTFNYQDNGRTYKYQMPYTPDLLLNSKRAKEALDICREKTKGLPTDSFQVPIENLGESVEEFKGELPTLDQVTDTLFEKTKGLDFVGQLAMGNQIRANMNSKGQKHWFSSENFQVDYSFFTHGQKALKGLYAGRNWDSEKFARDLENSKKELEILKKPEKKLERGKYKVYLAPAALSEIVDMMSWGGVSYSALKRGRCAFKKLSDGEKSFSPKFNLIEDFNLGLTAKFNDRGELSPKELTLVKDGKLENFLINSRTAKEYGINSNGASAYEGMRSPKVETGNLKKSEILENLKDGIYISNLHYLNWSDIQSGRLTGMTRYACFWVENGEIKAPIADLRFDESLYNIFGEGLESVTEFGEVIPHVGSYGLRSLGGKKVPGMIVNDFHFTL